jgi:hypothetical protein
MQSKPIPPQLLKRILSEKFQKRFWSKIEKRRADECWPWKAGTTDGYGRIRVTFIGQTAVFGSHQIAWISSQRKDIPLGKCVLHSCIASRNCCNPFHLRTGTPLENTQDMDLQGRRKNDKGEANTNAKLTNDKVLEIQAKYSSGKYFQQQLADEFGVSQTQIWRVVRRRAWTHI